MRRSGGVGAVGSGLRRFYGNAYSCWQCDICYMSLRRLSHVRTIRNEDGQGMNGKQKLLFQSHVERETCH